MYLEALARDLERTQRAIPSSCLFCAPQPRSLLADQTPSLDEVYTHFLTPAGAADDAHARRAGEYETLNGACLCTVCCGVAAKCTAATVCVVVIGGVLLVCM